MRIKKVKNIPELKVSRTIKEPDLFNLKKKSTFHYGDKEHKKMPHVIKFSGGRTSGMLLFVLLEAGMLKAERGDVVVFNNTSAEHPKTYDFVKQCKRIVEKRYDIPFFWVEHQTYEDARNGKYVRLPSFRLVNDNPYSENNTDGYHWRGEVFEELLSYKGYVPTLFQRTCTKTMKIETSRMFLKEWLANKEKTERLGHFGNSSRLDDDEMYEHHLKNQGSVPKKIFIDKKQFVKGRPFFRPSQAWKDFSPVAKPLNNKYLEGKVFGRSAYLGEGGIEYLSFVGIRNDEMRRVHKIQSRNEGADSEGYEGEYVYMPLAGMKANEESILDFWDQQTWGLDLKASDYLSNCTFCFLKGTKRLQHIKDVLGSDTNDDLIGTPCDINWWVEIEKKYGRDMKAEDREIRSSVVNDFIGFFGTGSSLTYEEIAKANGNLNYISEDILPCDCTD